MKSKLSSAISFVYTTFLVGFLSSLINTSPAIAQTVSENKSNLVPVNPGFRSRVTGMNSVDGADEVCSQLLSQKPNGQFSDSSENEKILRQLPNSEMKVYVLDYNIAAKAGLIYLGIEAAKRSSIVVQDYLMYRKCNDNSLVGIGVRLLVVVNEKNAKISTLSIPSIAIQADFRKLQAKISLKTLGISSKEITQGIPMPAELNFTTLYQMYQGVDQIKGAIWNGATITPQVLAVTEDTL
jgi:hypothetical protein